MTEAVEIWRKACIAYGGASIEGGEGEMLAARVIAEALAARDEKIAELERERETLSGLVQGWHYLAVGPDEMGDYHTQKQLIKLSEPYASPALKALKEKNDVA